MTLYLPGPRYLTRLASRIKVIYLLAMAGIVVLVLRLGHLQIVNHLHYVRQAETQIIRSLTLHPPRGEIFDRNGELIVGNQPGLRLRLYPERMTSYILTAGFLREVLTSPPEGLTDLLKKARKTRPYRAWTLKENIERDELARLMARSHEHPELGIEAAPLRWYPWVVTASHLLGHLGEITEREMQQWKSFRLYLPGDLVGKNGIEARYEPWLFGTRGREDVKVDALGRSREVVRRVPPIPGWDLMLTLDLPTQRAAEDALGGRKGAIVALDPRNGEILALASHPNFDPELFLKQVSDEEWQQVLMRPDHPFVFRPLSGLYPPGSTLKPFVALMALAEGIIRPGDKIPCSGFYRLGKRTFRCWRRSGHGLVDLYRALVESCDVYFYELGRRLGSDRMNSYARLFGFGMRTGIDLEEEKSGLFPDPQWKLRFLREAWQPGETIIAAIGQGYVLVTPLQLAVAYAVLANGGYRVTPHLFSRFLHTDRPAPPFDPPNFPTVTVGLPSQALSLVRQALYGVVNEPSGTGRYARLREVKVAGKTGTAQVVSMEKREKSRDPFHEDHAWFVAFAPFHDPRIVVAVLVEHGGQGGGAAAPLARRVIEAYLLSRNPPQG